MPGAVLGANLHPYGNRGPDLIETIRLERCSGPHVRVSPHPSVDTKQGVAIRREPLGQHRKMWNEPRWDRPQSAAASLRLRVHNPALVQDILAPPSRGGGDRREYPDGVPDSPIGDMGSPLPEGRGRFSRAGSPLPPQQSSHTASSDANKPGGKRRPQTAHVGKAGKAAADSKRQQDAYAAHQAQHAKVMQRLRFNQEQAARKSESDFNNLWDSVCAGEEEIVEEVSGYLELREMERVRKAAALCRGWNNDIFDKVQTQIEKEVNRREKKGEIQARVCTGAGAWAVWAARLRGVTGEGGRRGGRGDRV